MISINKSYMLIFIAISLNCPCCKGFKYGCNCCKSAGVNTCRDPKCLNLSYVASPAPSTASALAPASGSTAAGATASDVDSKSAVAAESTVTISLVHHTIANNQ